MDLRQLMVRRDLLAALITILAAPRAWAGEPPSTLRDWQSEVAALREALLAGAIDQAAWCAGVERAIDAVPLNDLVASLDLDRVAATLPHRLAGVRDVASPADDRANSFIRLFGMRRGACLLPHVHNGMVSAHLVVSGAFHVRTHDRIRDLGDAVVLRQTRDEIIGVGEVLTMSDGHDNQHWLVAQQDRSFTLDIAVFNLAPPPGRLPAHFEHTLLVDPLQPPERNGTIIAPVLDFPTAAAKFAA